MTGVFDRILCGVPDWTDGLDAVRQAARLRAPGGTLRLLCALDLSVAVAGGWSATHIAEELEREAEESMRRAREIAPDAGWRVLRGSPVPLLLGEIERESTTLVAVGFRRGPRLAGILLGGVTTALLHEAPCSVLVARPPADEARFPRSIVVGLDGSPQSEAAAAVAADLSRRLEAELRPLVALGGKEVDVEAGLQLLPGAATDAGRPVDALLEAAREADLLVVGSRGLHGVRALGSVSERAAHRATCSVLVVREQQARPEPAAGTSE